jgi:hypothetical protein
MMGRVVEAEVRKRPGSGRLSRCRDAGSGRRRGPTERVGEWEGERQMEERVKRKARGSMVETKVRERSTLGQTRRWVEEGD